MVLPPVGSVEVDSGCAVCTGQTGDSSAAQLQTGETGAGAAAAAEEPCFGLKKRRRKALETTNTELKLMASAATIGFIFSWKAA